MFRQFFYSYSSFIINNVKFNQRHTGSKNPYSQYENIDEDGTPLCADDDRVVRDGYDNRKMAAKYRCPVMMARRNHARYSANVPNPSVEESSKYMTNGKISTITEPVQRESTTESSMTMCFIR